MILKPVEIIYHWLGDLRNFLFRKNILRSRRLSLPVISVGNISFGGVGKTPFIVFLANELSRDHKITVISKSYRGSLKKPAQVEPAQPEVFGDEACLLAQKLPQARVWAGPVKWKTAAAAQVQNDGLLLIDDGFSHRELARNFDLVLVDALAGVSGYHRERISSLGRASAILITRTNLAGADKTAKLKARLKAIVPDALVFTAISVSILKLQPQSEIFAFCGLGNPGAFKRDLELQGYIVRETRFFKDHHRFTEDEQLRLLADRKNLKLVCTEKDFIKLTNEELKKQVHVVAHSLQMPETEKEGLLAQIRNSL
jgi:tetraacyldisaccharide 4'-kinase